MRYFSKEGNKNDDEGGGESSVSYLSKDKKISFEKGDRIKVVDGDLKGMLCHIVYYTTNKHIRKQT